MDWRQASVGVRVSFPTGRFSAAGGTAQAPATIVGVGQRKGHGGEDAPCYVKLDNGHQVACRVWWLGIYTPKLNRRPKPF
jgi:hypothetical protein